MGGYHIHYVRKELMEAIAGNYLLYMFILKMQRMKLKVYLLVDKTILRAGFPGGSVGKESTCNAGDVGSPVHGGLLCPPAGDLSDPGTEPVSLMSPALVDRFLTTSATSEPHTYYTIILYICVCVYIYTHTLTYCRYRYICIHILYTLWYISHFWQN